MGLLSLCGALSRPQYNVYVTVTVCKWPHNTQTVVKKGLRKNLFAFYAHVVCIVTAFSFFCSDGEHFQRNSIYATTAPSVSLTSFRFKRKIFSFCGNTE